MLELDDLSCSEHLRHILLENIKSLEKHTNSNIWIPDNSSTITNINSSNILTVIY